MSNLIEAVKTWNNEQLEEGYTGALNDLLQHGCVSGMVSDLIYYRDTCAFYLKHKAEIWAMLDTLLDDCGLDRVQDLLSSWDTSDRWAEDTHNQNLLAWFGFEHAASMLAE